MHACTPGQMHCPQCSRRTPRHVLCLLSILHERRYYRPLRRGISAFCSRLFHFYSLASACLPSCLFCWFQECPSPQFNLTSSGKSSLYFGSTSSKDISASNGGGGLGLGQVTLQDRRSSLQQRNVSVIRSEPNISRRCSLDPVTLKRLSEPFGFSQDLPGMQSHSLSRLPFHCNSSGNSSAAVPTTPSNVGGAEGRGFQQQMQPHPLQSSCSPHGSNSHLSMHGGSNPQLNSLHGSNSSIGGAGGGIGGVMGGDDMNLPLGGGSDGNRGSGEFYPTPEDIIKQTDRSQSLGNIYSSVHNQLGNQYQHHSHHHHNHMPTHHQQGGSDGLMSGLHPQRSSVGVSMINSSTSNLSPPAPAPPTQGMPGGTTHRRSSDSPLQTYQKRKHSGYGATSRGMAKKPRSVAGSAYVLDFFVLFSLFWFGLAIALCFRSSMKVSKVLPHFRYLCFF